MFKKAFFLRVICLMTVTALTLGFYPAVRADAAALTDVAKTDYYYTEVTAMYGQGVISGYTDGSFRPQSAVTRAEALKLVCAMAGVNSAGYSGKTDPWYSDVVAWTQANGIIAAGTDVTVAATREEISAYIVAVYQLDTETATDAFSDTDSAVANTLYDYGVVKGIPNPDGTVAFSGYDSVRRCDTCIMLYRLGAQVNKPDWSDAFALDLSHYSVSRPASFKSYDDYVNAWRYMLVNTVFQDSFQAKVTCTKSQLQAMLDDVMDAYYFAEFDYLEYASFLNQWEVSVSYSTDGKGNCYNPVFKLELSNGFGISNTEITRQLQAFETRCAEIVTGLYQQGALTASMSVREKARVLYNYVDYNTKYDTSYTYYNGYDAAVRKTAVCQGYTAFYNYLCNLAGIDMEAMTGQTDGSGHAWSRMYYNGSYVNVDVTWGDPIPDQANYSDETWFWVTDSYLKTCSDPRTFDSDGLVYG